MTLTLEESARRAGAHQWAETRLFEVLGGWVATTEQPEARLLLDRHSRHCSWRAGEWWERLPVLADLDRPALCRPPTTGAAQAVEAMDRLEGTVARLAGAYRFALPRLLTAYQDHLRLLGPSGPVADGSTLRTLGMTAADVASDWREGEAALQDLVRTRASIRVAADAVAAMEDILAED